MLVTKLQLMQIEQLVSCGVLQTLGKKLHNYSAQCTSLTLIKIDPVVHYIMVRQKAHTVAVARVNVYPGFFL